MCHGLQASLPPPLVMNVGQGSLGLQGPEAMGKRQRLEFLKESRGQVWKAPGLPSDEASMDIDHWELKPQSAGLALLSILDWGHRTHSHQGLWDSNWGSA